jgi:hypothetical protein
MNPTFILEHALLLEELKRLHSLDYLAVEDKKQLKEEYISYLDKSERVEKGLFPCPVGMKKGEYRAEIMVICNAYSKFFTKEEALSLSSTVREKYKT